MIKREFHGFFFKRKIQYRSRSSHIAKNNRLNSKIKIFDTIHISLQLEKKFFFICCCQLFLVMNEAVAEYVVDRLLK